MTPVFDTAAEAFAVAGMTVFERGWLSSNGALFRGGDESASALVDTGYVAHAEQTLALVRRALAGAPLARIVCTHLHSDHCGGNAALQAAYGSRTWVPAGDFAKVAAWDEAALTYLATGQRCPRFTATAPLRAGDAIELDGRPWQVIASPGHDPESVVLYQADVRLLLSADALWENGFGVVFPEIEGLEAFGALGETLDRLAGLPIDWVVPGHGRPFGAPHAAIDRARRRLDGFVKDPVKHANHAAKVLLKFHLLEVRSQTLVELSEWLASVPYLRLLHQAHFADRSLAHWCAELIGALCRSAAARVSQGIVYDA